MKNLKKAILAIVLFNLLGCANPSIVNINKEETKAISSDAKIFIPRFEGKPDFVEESTDYFISQLESGISNTVIQGSSLRNEPGDISNGGNLTNIDAALRAANANGADILIMGKVTSHSTAGTLNGFSTIRLYNARTGKRIANFHRPSGLLFAYSEHQCVMAAVKETSKDTIKLFE